MNLTDLLSHLKSLVAKVETAMGIVAPVIEIAVPGLTPEITVAEEIAKVAEDVTNEASSSSTTSTPS